LSYGGEEEEEVVEVVVVVRMERRWRSRRGEGERWKVRWRETAQRDTVGWMSSVAVAKGRVSEIWAQSVDCRLVGLAWLAP